MFHLNLLIICGMQAKSEKELMTIIKVMRRVIYPVNVRHQSDIYGFFYG